MSDYDPAKLQDGVLARLTVFSFGNGRTWKTHDWSVMDALQERGFITQPGSKAKSAYLTDEGLARGREVAAQPFGASQSAPPRVRGTRKPR